MSAGDTAVADASRGSRNSRPSLWYALASLVVALTAYATAWRGGVWLLAAVAVLVPVALRHRSSAERRGGRLDTAFVVVAVLAGASALITSGGLQPALRTTSASYSPGDQVTIELRSGWQGATSNLCPVYVQPEGGDGPQTPPVPAVLEPSGHGVIGCILLAQRLMPFMGTDGVVHLPTDLAPGEYRLVHDVSVGNSKRRVETRPFTVE